MCLDRPQHNIAVAEADTHNSAWAPDVVVGISRWAALFSISREIAERLVDYGDELSVVDADMRCPLCNCSRAWQAIMAIRTRHGGKVNETDRLSRICVAH